MSTTLIEQVRHLQERLAKAEQERDALHGTSRHFAGELDAARREIADLRALLRVFGREHTHAEIAPRGAFARAAELVAEEGAK